MSTHRLPVVPFLAVTLFASSLALAQGHGGGGGGSKGGATTSSMVNPTANANGNIATGTGNTLDTTTVHLSSASDEGKVEFRSQSVLIQVPVVVTDKSGSHLRGLNKEDFTILENGKPQNVSTFEEITSSTTPLVTPAAAPAGQFRNLAIDSSQPRNVVVVALDTVNTPFLDQTYGRRELIKYLAQNVDPGQVMALMVITTHGLKVIQGLNGDPAKLADALKRVSGELPALTGVSAESQETALAGDSQQLSQAVGASSGSDSVLGSLNSFVEHGDAIEAQFYQSNAIETTMNGFLGIAWSLSGVPGRKSVIWATGGFPFAMDSPSTVPGGYLSLLYERTMLALNDAQISVYPVDVRGLVNSPSFVGGRSSGISGGIPANRQTTSRMWLNQAKIDTLNDFADMTGGKAFYNTNDIAGSFKRAADDASSYYLVGYYLDTSNNKSGWRKLQVRVAGNNKKDVEVRARNGFFVTNATMNPLLSRDRDMSNALHSPIEGTGVPMTVQWVGLAADGDKKKAVFAAHMPGGGLSFEGARAQMNFDFAALAYDKDGKEAGHTERNYTPIVPEAQLASVKTDGMNFRNALELAPGKYTVRFVVRDNLTGKVGSVTAPLTVN
jgi:VWFA-related protein